MKDGYIIVFEDCYTSKIAGYLHKDAEYKQYKMTKELSEAKFFESESQVDLWNNKMPVPPAMVSYVDIEVR